LTNTAFFLNYIGGYSTTSYSRARFNPFKFAIFPLFLVAIAATVWQVQLPQTLMGIAAGESISISKSPESVSAYDIVVATFSLPNTYKNPYDPQEVNVYMHILQLLMEHRKK